MGKKNYSHYEKKKNLLYPLNSIKMDYYTCFAISFFFKLFILHWGRADEQAYLEVYWISSCPSHHLKFSRSSNCSFPLLHLFYSWVGLVVKNLLANTGDIRDRNSAPGLGRSPGGGLRQPTPVLLPAESHGHKSPEGYSPLGSERGEGHQVPEKHTYTQPVDNAVTISGEQLRD